MSTPVSLALLGDPEADQYEPILGLNAMLGDLLPRTLGSGAPVWSPAALFAAGEKGAWYDPSDLSTMFQDSAGTTPVTAVEQPVGLVLDKSRGLVLGSELLSNGTFASDYTGWSSVNGAGLSVVGGKLRVTSNSASYGAAVDSTVTPVVGKTYRVSLDIESSGLNCSIQMGGVTMLSVAARSGTYTGYVIATAASKLTLIANTTTGNYVDFDNISIKELAGNHAAQATAAARPVLRNDGVNNYLDFDGVDDSLATTAIDFSANDEMSVVAGIRKSSDVARGIAVELSAAAANNGAFTVGAPNNAGVPEFRWVSGGTNTPTIVYAAPAVAAPITAVVTCTNKVATSAQEIRINGVSKATGSTSQGTGNYGNHPLYIGRRAGTSLPFIGRIYALIVRGTLTSGADLDNVESYVNSKTGAY